MTTKTMIAGTTIAGPKLKTAIPGQNAKRIVAGDEKYISPSYTRSYPLVAKRGRGIVVEDVDGNEFFDFSAGIAVTSTGHCHSEVVAAIQKQASELIHMSGTDFYYESMVTLAERLSKIAPMPGPHRVYYGNSGAEAIECALKLARYHTKRQQGIAFFGAFHGRTMGALSLTASTPQQKRGFSALVPGDTHVRYPAVYRGCPGGPEDAQKRSTGCGRIDLWREPRLHGRSAGHARGDRERRAAKELAGSRRPHAETHGRLAEEAQDCWRCPRPGLDDRRRDRERPDDSRVWRQ